MSFDFGYKSEFTSNFIRKVLDESFKASESLSKEFDDENDRSATIDKYTEKINLFRNILSAIAEIIPKSDGNQAVIKGYLDATA
jgi:hypothetical protein